MEKRIMSLLLAISLLFSMLPGQVLAAEGNAVYLRAENFWPSDQYDYMVWAWPTNGEGHWLLPQGPADANGWVTFLVDESNLLFVALNKGTAADWDNKAYQTGDLTLDPTQPYYILTSTTGGYWEASSCIHQWSSQVTVPPSCTATGTEVFTCALCGSSYQETLPRTDHNWQDETCADCGTVKAMVCLSAGHMFPDDKYDIYAWVWPEGGDGRWVAPAVTQNVPGFTAYPVEESDSGLSFVVFAQGQEPKWNTQVCKTNDLTANRTDCYVTPNAYTYGDEIISALTTKTEACNHSWTLTSELPATCTGFGITYLLCSQCQMSVCMEYPATGHSAQPGELTVVTAPTCTEDGLSTYVCEVCTETVEVTVPPTGHSLDGDGNCTVCDLHAVVVLTDAQGGTQPFGSFLDALNAAINMSENVTLTLMEDCTWTQELSRTLTLSGRSLTLDLNGRCLGLDFEEGDVTFREMHVTFKNGEIRLESGSDFFRTKITSVTMEDITVTQGSGDVISSIFLQETGATGVSKDFVFRNVTLKADLYEFLYLYDAAVVMEDCTIYTGTETNESQNMVALVNKAASLTLRGSGRYHQLVTAAGGGTLRPFLEEGMALKYIGQDQYANLDTNRATDAELVPAPLTIAIEDRYEASLNRPITITPDYTPDIENFDPDAVTCEWEIPTVLAPVKNEDGSITLTFGSRSGYWLTLTLGYKGYTAQKQFYVAFESCTIHEFENGQCIYCRDWEIPQDSDGDGFYEIYNMGNLYWFLWEIRTQTGLSAKLMCDIDMEQKYPSINTTAPYTGTFDGQGYTVSNVFVASDETHVGFFPWTQGATIRNLGLSGSIRCVTAAEEMPYVGGVVGNAGQGTTIQNCWTNLTIQGSNRIGGICGFLDRGTIEDCRSQGTIQDNDTAIAVGGIVASNVGLVQRCINNTRLEIDTLYSHTEIGGIAGTNYRATVQDCANYGIFVITGTGGTVYSGGIVGGNSTEGIVRNCYNIPTSDESNQSPIVGLNDSTVENCYYLTGYGSNKYENCTAVTSSQLASGEVTYLLNGSTADETSAWRQTLGTDAYPMLSGPLVYYGEFYSCDGTSESAAYRNQVPNTETPPHDYQDNGLCVYCRQSGTPAELNADGYYEIDTPAKLWWFSQQVSARRIDPKAVLTADIDMSTTCGPELGDWVPISTPYGRTGSFDGRGHTISNLYMAGEYLYVGLFGKVYNLTIENLGVTGSFSSTMLFDEKYHVAYAGGIVAEGNTTTIRNCWVDMTLSGESDIGGICGLLDGGSIEDCTARGTVSTRNLLSTGIAVGGILGKLLTGTVRSCVNEATVSAQKCSDIGGIVGCNTFGQTVESCRNLGTISGGETNVNYYDAAGGIVGNNCGVIRSCANLGAVTVAGAADYVGGIAGGNNYSEARIENCYSTGTLTAASGTPGTIFGDSGDGTSTATDNYYLSATETEDGGRTADQFASGQVAYELNRQTTADTNVWRQTIGTDPCPVFDGPLVYKGSTYRCDGIPLTEYYSNTYPGIHIPPHSYGDDGLCTVCRHSNVPAVDSDGDGYYEIDTPAKLWWFAQEVNRRQEDFKAVLTADIDLSTTCGEELGSWEPIDGFSGHFNGQGHTITNLYCAMNGTDAGLFDYVSFGTIENLTVTGQVLTKGDNTRAGGIAANTYDSTIRNCQSYVTVQGELYAGGICGTTGAKTLIENCRNLGQVLLVNDQINYKYGGGIAGSVSGTVRNCANLADVTMTTSDDYSYAGGLAGYIGSEGTLENSYNMGIVTTTAGLAGPVYDKSAGTITNSYYLSDTATEDGGRTADQFASGQVAYELNRQTTADTNVWRQTIGTDPCPLFAGPLVYYGALYTCDGTLHEAAYRNEVPNTEVPPHTFENGFCTVCDAFEEAARLDGVYQIQNGGNLFWFSQQVASEPAANAQVVADIDLENREWSPIDNYCGTFDGGGHSITNLSITVPATRMGFFGRTISPAVIRNFTIHGLIRPSASGDCYLGSVAADSGDNEVYNGSTISNVVSLVDIDASAGKVTRMGGILTSLFGGTVSNCLYLGTVQGSANDVGGIVGYARSGHIENCGMVGSVSSTNYVGGILGYVNNNATHIRSCYTYGTVTSTNTTRLGAIIGRARSNFAPANAVNNYYNPASCANAFGSECEVTITATSMAAESFHSGEVTWLLNGGDNGAWKQTIDGQSLPGFSGDPVYRAEEQDCGGNLLSYQYRNTAEALPLPDHSFDSQGKCTVCQTQATISVTLDNQVHFFLRFQEAVTKAEKGTEEMPALIRLLANVETTASTMTGGVATLELNGYSIFLLYDGIYRKPMLTTRGANLTVQDSSEAQTGLIRNQQDVDFSCMLSVEAGSQLEWKSGTLDGENYFDSPMVNVFERSKVIQSGGKIMGQITLYSSDFILRGGEIVGDTTGVTAMYLDYGPSNVCIEGGSISVQAGKPLLYIWDDSTLTVTGGTFATRKSDGTNTFSLLRVRASQYYDGSLMVPTVTLGGGTFLGGLETEILSETNEVLVPYNVTPLAKILGKGYGYQTEDGTFVTLTEDQTQITQTVTVAERPYVASVTRNGTETLYATLQEAFDAAASGTEAAPATVTLLRDIALDQTEKGFTWSAGTGSFDLNGHSILRESYNDAPDGEPMLNIIRLTGGTLTIRDSIGGGMLDSYGNYGMGITHTTVLQEAGTLILESGTLGANSKSVLLMLGGSFRMEGGALQMSVANNGVGIGQMDDAQSVRIEILGGTISGAMGLYLMGDAQVEISGGTIHGENSLIQQVSGSLDISGGTFQCPAPAEGMLVWTSAVTATITGGTFENGFHVVGQIGEDFGFLDLNTVLPGGYGFRKSDDTFLTLTQGQTQITESVTVARLPEVVSVDIAWGGLAFTYTDGVWDPDTLTYETGTWAPDAQGGDLVTVTNAGTLDTTVSVTYAPAQGYSAISGSFSQTQASLAVGEEKTFRLTLSGKPESRFQSAALGTITLTIGGE